MLYQEFYLNKYKWKIYEFYDTTKDDVDEIMDCLFHLNCDAKNAKHAYDNISENKPNIGLTFSKNNKTCIVMGRASDTQNFAHTFTHEITHLASHIANKYKIDQNSEQFAYLVGDLGAIMLPYASKFMCNNCNKTKGI